MVEQTLQRVPKGAVKRQAKGTSLADRGGAKRWTLGHSASPCGMQDDDGSPGGARAWRRQKGWAWVVGDGQTGPPGSGMYEVCVYPGIDAADSALSVLGTWIYGRGYLDAARRHCTWDAAFKRRQVSRGRWRRRAWAWRDSVLLFDAFSGRPGLDYCTVLYMPAATPNKLLLSLPAALLLHIRRAGSPKIPKTPRPYPHFSVSEGPTCLQGGWVLRTRQLTSMCKYEYEGGGQPISTE